MGGGMDHDSEFGPIPQRIPIHPFRSKPVELTIEDRVRQALSLLQDVALFGKSDSAMVESYTYSINPNCYDEDDEETFDDVEVVLKMRINRRPDENDGDIDEDNED